MSTDKAKTRLQALIAARLREPHRAPEIDEKIWKEFGTECTVLTGDLSGYTRTTKEHGIVHFLSMHHQSLELSAPVIEAAEGFVLNAKADNLTAIFDHPIHAIEAAMNMNGRLKGYNLKAPNEARLHVCIGIGHGKVLKTETEVYGDEVNVAYKLGEDTAGPGEILLSDAAYEHVISIARLRFRFGPRETIRTGGIDLGFYRLLY